MLFQFQKSWSPTGDEPHYLIAAQSLIEDNTLDLRKVYNEERYREYYKFPDTLGKHIYSYKGKELPFHYIGLSAALIPFYYMAGTAGARFFMLLIFLLFIFFLYKLAVLFISSKNTAFYIVLLSSLSIPLGVFSIQIFPDMIAALIGITCLYLAFKAKKQRLYKLKTIIIFSALLALLPWFHMRFMFLLLPLYFIGYFLFNIKTPKKIFAYNIPVFFSAILFASFYGVFFGNILGPSSSDTSLFTQNLFKTIPAIFLDRQYGLFIFFPLLMYSFAGIYIFHKEQKKDLMVLSLVFLPSLFITASYPLWYGGWCPPGRFTLIWIPFLIILACKAITYGRTKTHYSLVVIFALYQLFLFYNSILYPVINYNVSGHDKSNLNLHLSKLSNLNFNPNIFFPSFLSELNIYFWLKIIGFFLIVIFITKNVFVEPKEPSLKSRNKKNTPAIFFFLISLTFFFSYFPLKYIYTAQYHKISQQFTIPTDEYIAYYYSNDNFNNPPHLIKKESKIYHNYSVFNKKPLGAIKWYSVAWKRIIPGKGRKHIFIESDSQVIIKINQKITYKHSASADNKSDFFIDLAENDNLFEVYLTVSKLNTFIKIDIN